MSEMSRSMITLVRERLKGYIPREIPTTKRTLSAGVIVPVFEKEEKMHVLLTRRSQKLNRHRGEVSFPGGLLQHGDRDTMAAALRECSEETGLKEEDIEVVGRLDDTITIAGIIITPYVGVIPYPYRFVTDPDEVAYLIHLPLENVINEEDSYSMYWGRDYIWGSTYGILYQLKTLITT
jgi:8-oxo-dGTP pyrophosphatase MutT (NUDIX family)